MSPGTCHVGSLFKDFNYQYNLDSCVAILTLCAFITLFAPSYTSLPQHWGEEGGEGRGGGVSSMAGTPHHKGDIYYIHTCTTREKITCFLYEGYNVKHNVFIFCLGLQINQTGGPLMLRLRAQLASIL